MLLAVSLMSTHAIANTALDRELRAIVEDPQRPLAGLAVVAIRDGRIVYQSNPDRLYRIASITKLVVALGVLRLVEQGKLDLDEDVGKYIGDPLRNPRFPAVPITLRMLLSHTSSLRDDAGYAFPAGHDMRAFLRAGAMWAANAPPGAYFSYCNLNSGVVGTIMEKVTGERFDRLMQWLVLDPLGMRGGFNPAEMPPERVREIAPIYRKATAGETQVWNPEGPWIPQVDDYSREPPVNRAGPDYVIGSNGALFGPQGNLRASAADLARVVLMLVNRGMLDGKRFLQARTVETVFARHWKSDGGANGETTYGTRKQRMNAWGLGNQQFVGISGPALGDRLVEGGGFRAIGHHGDAYGLHGMLAFDPEKRNGIVYLAGGTGFDPETDPGAYSGFNRYEERILTAVHRRAIEGKAE